MKRLTSQMENFRGKRDFLKGGPKFPNGISERKLCVPFALSDQFQALRIGSLGTVNGQQIPGGEVLPYMGKFWS